MEQKNQCSFCDKLFGSSTSLKAHVQNFHVSDEARYVTCNICQRQVSKYSLKIHLNSHTREKLQCPHCEYEVKSSEVFKYHMMIEHNDTSFGVVRVHHCKYCDYKHTKKNSVNIHQQTVHGTLKQIIFLFQEKHYKRIHKSDAI